jgi:hypothetical protein
MNLIAKLPHACSLHDKSLHAKSSRTSRGGRFVTWPGMRGNPGWFAHAKPARMGKVKV